MSPWKFFIDTGGTFTDCLAISPSSEKHTLKILSSAQLHFEVDKKIDNRSYLIRGQHIRFIHLLEAYTCIEAAEAVSSIDLQILKFKTSVNLHAGDRITIQSPEPSPLFAIRLLTDSRIHDTLPKCLVKIGTTRATNALLEESEQEILAIHSKGFKDLIRIGDQRRPNLFQLNVPPKPILHDQVFEEDKSDSWLKELKNESDKQRGIAICLKNAFYQPQKELDLKRKICKLGFTNVHTSYEVSPRIGYLDRTTTTHVNTYLSNSVDRFFNELKQGIPQSIIRIMQSDGQLAKASNFKPKDGLLSGPAGGVKALANFALTYRLDKVIGFDMGGTSTDVSFYDGNFDFDFETQIGKHKIQSKSVSIHTVAAGGGSVCNVKNGLLTVGPESAGAYPGPACYGHKGPLSLTDLNLALGRLSPEECAIPMDKNLSINKIKELLSLNKMDSSKWRNYAEEWIELANLKMANAVRELALKKGRDCSEYHLIAFGGAAGLHACEVAELLHIENVYFPADSGIFSAVGIQHARDSFSTEKELLQDYMEIRDSLYEIESSLIDQLKLPVDKNFNLTKLYRVRLYGQDYCLELHNPDVKNIHDIFIERFLQIYGFTPTNPQIEIHSIHLSAEEKEELNPYYSFNKKSELSIIHLEKSSWANLNQTDTYSGELCITHPYCTVFIPKSWHVYKSQNNDLRAFKLNNSKINVSIKESVVIEKLNAIAKEMGSILQRSSFSVNIKERLDFSCAIINPKKELIINAPHIPVHLGSLGICTRLMLKHVKLKKGDVAITNHPAYGGSHLPDITLIKAVYDEDDRLIAYVINRAHHAEIGGITPGSMPPNANSLEEEGVIFEPQLIVTNQVLDQKKIISCLSSAKYPSRNIHENLRDIEAALASLNYGEKALIDLAKELGNDVLISQMNSIITRGKKVSSDFVRNLRITRRHVKERLDDGSLISISIASQNDKLLIDFTGTSSTHHGNLNAGIAIVHSVILYVLRLVCNDDIPLNDGFMYPIHLILPHCLLNPVPNKDGYPAVVAGNTELSQRLTNGLLKALDISAASQGTMNNVLFGNAHFGYYETIGGGTGAGIDFHGTDAVHQHMTNTKITDPEIIENRYPVEILAYEIRENSGGSGSFRGGNGIRRVYRFKEDLDVTVITQHRTSGPAGMNGGEPGKPGNQYIIDVNGRKLHLSSQDHKQVKANSLLYIETPGGGAYGKE